MNSDMENGQQKQQSICMANDEQKMNRTGEEKDCLMNDETQITNGSFNTGNNSSFQSEIFDALDYQDMNNVWNIISKNLLSKGTNHSKSKPQLDDLMQLRCPKTQLNILQFCILYQNKTKTGEESELKRILDILSNNNITHVDFEDQQENRGSELKSQELFDLVFKLKSSSGNNQNAIQANSEQQPSEMKRNTPHPMTSKTAFEIAIAKGDIASIKCINETFSHISIADNCLSETILQTALKHDQGSTLQYLQMYFNVIKVFESTDIDSLLLQACKMKAKHSVRFLLSLSNSISQQKLLTEQINEVIANINEDTDQQICILYELLSAEEKFIEKNGANSTQYKEISQFTIKDFNVQEKKKAHEISYLLNKRVAMAATLYQLNTESCYKKKKGCLPERTHACYKYFFYITFWIIYLTNAFVINPKLDDFCFLMATTLVSLKLFLTFYNTNTRNPGILQLTQDDKLTYKEILENIPQDRICPKCQVIRTETKTVHCPVTDQCIDRYDQYSWWANNAIGRSNHGFYFAFTFFLWLDTFLVGFIDGRSITVTECDLPDNQPCPLEALCLGCDNMPLHYISTVYGAIVCLFFFFPSQVVCCRQDSYFRNSKTTFEKRGAHYKDMCFFDEIKANKFTTSYQQVIDSIEQQTKDNNDMEQNLIEKVQQERRNKQKKGCCSGYKEMTCNRKVRSQKELYMAITKKE